MQMTPAELTARFERTDLAVFTHADHVRVACTYLDRVPEDLALTRLVGGLARFAAAKGEPGKFHYTRTRAWLTLIADARRRHPEATTPDQLMAVCPALADSRALDRFYSTATLNSPAARDGWVSPDLQAIAATL